MLKLVAALAVVAALAAAVLYAPIRGRTIADRWNAAPGLESFATDAWSETRRALDGDSKRDVGAPSPLPAARRAGSAAAQRDSRDAKRAPAKPMPVEHHTAEDRAALDRLLSERSR